MSGFVDGVAISSGFVVVLTGAAAIVGGSLRSWRKTIGSRRSLRRMINSLNVGLPAENLPAMFGSAVIRRNPGPLPMPYADLGPAPVRALQQQIFVTRHACIDTFIEDELQTVVAFCVTVTDPRFHFDAGKLSFDVFKGLDIGRTAFAAPAVPQDGPNRFAWWMGARDAGYAEAHDAGNPGGYQTYVLAHLGTGVGDLAAAEVPGEESPFMLGGFDEPKSSTAGGGCSDHDSELTSGEREYEEEDIDVEQSDTNVWATDDDVDSYGPVDDWKWFRAKTTVNTFQVLGPEWSSGFIRPGVHGDITRLLREPPRSLTDRIRQRWVRMRAQRAIRRLQD